MLGIEAARIKQQQRRADAEQQTDREQAGAKPQRPAPAGL